MRIEGHTVTEITISEDITFNTFSMVLKFLYTGKKEVSGIIIEYVSRGVFSSELRGLTPFQVNGNLAFYAYTLLLLGNMHKMWIVNLKIKEMPQNLEKNVSAI